MTTAELIDGKAFAVKVRSDVADRVAAYREEFGGAPGLAVVLVGADPASEIYVRNKGKMTREAGMESFEHKLPADTTEQDLLALVEDLNRDARVHGILVQLPLPKHISEQKVIATIDPQKDVDGFHVVNAGLLATGGDGMVPCTPLGCLMMLKDRLGDLSGRKALVIGRSNIVGKPMAQLLLKESCTVTIAHSRTKDLAAECRQADIIVAAVGVPELVRGDWIKPGAVIIDVGMNRLPKDDGKMRLAGDVNFAEVAEVASAITPVPGGVGPMTIACLLANTITAAERQATAD